jgi:hypothetical protein
MLRDAGYPIEDVAEEVERIQQRAFEQAALARTPPATTLRYANTSACPKPTRASLRCHCWPPPTVQGSQHMTVRQMRAQCAVSQWARQG